MVMRAVGNATIWDEVALDDINKPLTEIHLEVERNLYTQSRTNCTRNLLPSLAFDLTLRCLAYWRLRVTSLSPKKISNASLTTLRESSELPINVIMKHPHKEQWS